MEKLGSLCWGWEIIKLSTYLVTSWLELLFKCIRVHWNIMVRAAIQELVKSWAVLQTTEYGLIFYAALHFPFRMHLSWNTKTCVKSWYVQLLNKLHAMAVLIEIAWHNIAHGRVTKTSKITKVFWSTFFGNVLSNTITIGIKVEAKAVGF